MSNYEYRKPTITEPLVPTRPFKAKMPMNNEILDADGRIFHYEFSDGKIIWFPGPSVFIGDGILHQMQSKDFSPAPEGMKFPTLEEVEKILTDIGKEYKKKSESEGSFDFYETYKDLFGKSREELEEIIEDGAYNIGSGGWMVITGKCGLINAILTFDDMMKNAAKEKGYIK